jgi:hypothetical protein
MSRAELLSLVNIFSVDPSRLPVSMTYRHSLPQYLEAKEQ